MKRLYFSTEINAPKDKVWKSLWEDKNYRNWTSAFCEGSHMKADWTEGGKVLFLDPNDQGMSSRIAKLDEGTYVSFEHIADYKDGEQQATPEWTGAQENYRLVEIPGGTRLEVEVDITEPHVNYFNDAFPKGLSKVKEIAES